VVQEIKSIVGHEHYSNLMWQLTIIVLQQK